MHEQCSRVGRSAATETGRLRNRNSPPVSSLSGGRSGSAPTLAPSAVAFASHRDRRHPRSLRRGPHGPTGGGSHGGWSRRFELPNPGPLDHARSGWDHASGRRQRRPARTLQQHWERRRGGGLRRRAVPAASGHAASSRTSGHRPRSSIEPARIPRPRPRVRIPRRRHSGAESVGATPCVGTTTARIGWVIANHRSWRVRRERSI